jgi:hypothetical protein
MTLFSDYFCNSEEIKVGLLDYVHVEGGNNAMKNKHKNLMEGEVLVSIGQIYFVYYSWMWDMW